MYAITWTKSKIKCRPALNVTLIVDELEFGNQERKLHQRGANRLDIEVDVSLLPGR